MDRQGLAADWESGIAPAVGGLQDNLGSRGLQLDYSIESLHAVESVTALATGVLLFLPASNAYLHRDAHKPPPPPTFAEIVNAAQHAPTATAPRQHPPASNRPPTPQYSPTSNPAPADFDPFA